MKNYIKLALIILFFPTVVDAQEKKEYPELNYDKQEFEIKMRDGKTLFTQVYSPKDKSKEYPIMMQRTCYSVSPYGVDTFKTRLGPSKYLMEDGYIFVPDAPEVLLNKAEYNPKSPKNSLLCSMTPVMCS